MRITSIECIQGVDMSFYQCTFESAPAIEGDGWLNAEPMVCATCLKRYIPFKSEFVTPEDRVTDVDLEFLEKPRSPILQIAGLILVERSLVDVLFQNGVAGLGVSDRLVTTAAQPGMSLPEYALLDVTGRCLTNDVWTQVIDLCSACHTGKEVPVVRTDRRVCLKTLPITDVSRPREQLAGLIVSHSFKELIQRLWANEWQSPTFADVKVC